jgi:2-polyprenyl-6-methoxyphenol hydroxylase-like FAD-dependent oxidoreductase
LPCFELSYSIHRAKLIEVLSKPLSKDSFTLNSRIEQIEQVNQKVIVRVNNQQHEFDFLIAADGIHSATRKQFLPSLKPDTLTKLCGGMTKIDLPTHFDNCITELWGQNKRFGIMQRKGNEYFWYCVRCPKRK